MQFFLTHWLPKLYKKHLYKIQNFMRQDGKQLSKIEEHALKWDAKNLKMGPSRRGDAVKRFFSKVTLWVIPVTSVKTWCETIECSQEIEEHWKSNDSQKWAKNNLQELLWGDWKAWKQFHGFGIPWQLPSEVHAGFQNKFCIILRNNEILKQTKTHNLTELSDWI